MASIWPMVISGSSIVVSRLPGAPPSTLTEAIGGCVENDGGDAGAEHEVGRVAHGDAGHVRQEIEHHRTVLRQAWGRPSSARYSHITVAAASAVISLTSWAGSTSTTSMPTKEMIGEAADDGLGLPGGKAADFRRPGAGSEGRVQAVDVIGEVGRPVAAHNRDGALCDGSHAQFVHLLGGEDGNALVDRPIPDIALDRGADADLDHPARIDQPLGDGVVEDRAMTIDLAEIVIPGVGVRVEMNEAERLGPHAS